MITESMFDAIVVGSGAGGAAAAYELTRAGLRVALLEKGPRLPADGSTLDFRRVVQQGEFLSHEPWEDRRGRPLRPEEHFNVGGKTKWYGAALLRLGAHEFAAEPGFDCAGWPIDQQDMLAHYATAEALLGVREFEPEPDLARLAAQLAAPRADWQALPLPLGLSPAIVEDSLEARHFDGFATARGLKADADNAILARVIGEPNLRLITNAEVQALLASGAHSRAVRGVRLIDGRELRARVVLLAAGALHSPRLLERYVRSHDLAHLPMARHVGRNLKLHLLTAMVSVSATPKTDLIRKTMFFLHERFPHSSVQPLGFDGELIGTLIPRIVPRAIARGIGERAYGFFLQTEDGSSPANRVRDAGGGSSNPVLDYDPGRTPASEREHRALTRAFARSLLRAGLVSFTQRIGLNGTAHACGTLIAGESPESSVVDRDGRVHGLDGLYVVDGSVLPRSSRVNPSLTIFAWSLRVAGQLAARLTTGKVTPAGARCAQRIERMEA